MFDFWMTIARWLAILLVGAMSFNPFAFISDSFSIDSFSSALESTLAQIPEDEEEITEVIDGPGPGDPGDGALPPTEGPGQIGGPASEGPTPSVTPTETPTTTATATETAKSEPTATETPTQVPAATPRWDDPVLRWLPEIANASVQTGVPMSLLAAEVMVHSGGYPALAGPSNRYGLAQVPVSGSGVSVQALYDPQTNLNVAAARLAGFKRNTGTWNASILAELQGLCDANCVQERSTVIRAWRAYYNRVLAGPAGYGYVMLPGDWQVPTFDVQVISTQLPIQYPPGTAPPTATPSVSPTSTATPSSSEKPVETPVETPSSSPVPTNTATTTATVPPTAPASATPTATASPSPTATETPVGKQKKNGHSSG
jgi:hypothetical protein